MAGSSCSRSLYCGFHFRICGFFDMSQREVDWIDNDPRPWWVSSGDAFSQWINATFLKGHSNESVSGRCWREVTYNHRKGFWLFMHDTINSFAILFGDFDHCKKAYDSDVTQAARLLNYHGSHEK